MSPQLPGLHYSPQANQPPSIQPTRLASTTPLPISLDHSLFAHKHGSLQPLNAPTSSQAAVHSSSQQSGRQTGARIDSESAIQSPTPQQHRNSSSQQSGRQTGARIDSEPAIQSPTPQQHRNSSSQQSGKQTGARIDSEPAIQSFTPQHRGSSMLSYQPRNDDEVEDYKSHPGIRSPIVCMDDPLTEEDGQPNKQDCREGSLTTLHHQQNARQKQKVHFESHTKLAVEEHNISSHSFRGFGKPEPENENRMFATSASVSHGTGKPHTLEHDFISKSVVGSLSGFSPHKHLPPIPESGSESEEILPPSGSLQPHDGVLYISHSVLHGIHVFNTLYSSIHSVLLQQSLIILRLHHAVNMLLAKIRQVKDER